MLKINPIRSVIRTHFICSELSFTKIGELSDCSRQSVRRILKKCQRYNLTHPLAEQMTDKEVFETLYPCINANTSKRREPDYDNAIKELMKKNGKTKTVLFLEYHAVDPSTALSKTQYFRLVTKVFKKCRLSMRQHHIAGETIYIDYCGAKLHYNKKGEKVWVKVFVACLGASKKLFAWATYGEKTLHWIDGMIRMFEYYGGVCEVVSMDNAKALVSRPGLIATLASNVEAFGNHYGCVMDTCRVYRPQDKSLVELGARFLKQRIIIPANTDKTFFSIDEINEHLKVEVEKLNNELFQGFSISRNDLFEQIEKSELKPLPRQPFQMIVNRSLCKVPPNYHVKYEKHEYSVPYGLVQEMVEVIVNQTHLKVIYQHQVVAEHVVKNDPMGATTLSEHMPAEHLADSLETKDEYMLWAKDIGKDVSAFVDKMYSETKNPNSRAIGKRCKALKIICNKKGKSVVSKACNYALSHDMNTPTDISLIISAHEHDEAALNLPVFNSTHQNIRGKSYYGDHYDA